MKDRSCPQMGSGVYIALVLGCLVAVQARQASCEEEVPRLRERVEQLEKELSGLTGAPAPVSTRAAHARGLEHKKGSGDKGVVDRLLALLQGPDQRALSDELTGILLKGESGYPTLVDFLDRLDRDSTHSSTLIGKYQTAFSVMHTALLHEEEIARFAHYALGATRNEERCFAQSLIFGYGTVFLRYHQGRFPDLEKDLQRQISTRLEQGVQEDAPFYFLAAATLGMKLDLKVLESILVEAKDLGRAAPVIEHLQARDDAESTRLVTRVLNRSRQYKDWRGTALLVSLARMRNPDADRAMAQYLESADPQLRAAATLAYFAAPRTAASAPIAATFLNSSAEAREKQVLIARLRQLNPDVLEALRAQPERILDPALRESVQKVPAPRTTNK